MGKRKGNKRSLGPAPPLGPDTHAVNPTLDLSPEPTPTPTFTPGNVNEMVKAFDELTRRNGKGRPAVKKTLYQFKPAGSAREIPIYSYNCTEYLFRKRPCPFPTLARGLFVRELPSGWEIVVRGYDKFFNVGEVPSTEWSYMHNHTTGPYEVTLKENGCIIFVSAVDGHLIVTSKHAIGPARVGETGKPSHAEKGEEWVHTHLTRAGKTTADLVKFLSDSKITAVFELVDDDFEEHILEYQPEQRGLWLHGINENVPEFRTQPSDQIIGLAQEFGFHRVDALLMETLDDVRAFTDQVRESGAYKGRAVEGFVVRCHDSANPAVFHFFKVKYDEPYLMFREWREVTNRLLSSRGLTKFKPRFELTRKYVDWVRDKMITTPHLFAEYKAQKGIIRARNMFLQETNIPGLGEHIVAEARRTTAEFKRGEATVKAEDEVEAEMLEQDERLERGNKPQKTDGSSEPTRSPGKGGAEKTLILPIAAIGAGKTTLARILHNLYPRIAHVQSDNVTVKRAKEAFEHQVMEAFQENDVVIADKNNHMKEHRRDITRDFKRTYPQGRIIALDWQIEKMDAEQYVALAVDRVLQRGENHQSLTPSRTKDFRNVIWRFVRSRDAVDLKSDSDKYIDVVVPLAVRDRPREHLPAICAAVGWPVPSGDDYAKAEAAAAAFKESVVKNVESRNKKGPAYYGVKVPSEYDLASLLEKTLENHGADMGLWMRLKEAGRVEKSKSKGWHVTLCMCSQPAHVELVKMYEGMLKGVSDEARVSIKLHLLEIVWDDRLMAVAVKFEPSDIRAANIIPHITFATVTDEVKPVTSNEVLRMGYGEEKEQGLVKRVKFDEDVVIGGYLKAFSF
ncbi:hypothetical protein HK104_000204 [Borealophlyctis nickersoniae]|nr:hypothetical protein HK104_000204 [Borealophlyctis nickersoniae]